MTMQDRFKFLCGVKVCYYSDDGEDREVIIRFEPDTITKNGYVGFYFDVLIEKLKELGLSRHGLDTAVDYIACNYETETENWCLAEPEYLVQCTGLKDINGNLIYEGDIIQIEDYGYDSESCIYHTKCVWGSYYKAGFYLICGSTGQEFYINRNDLEVIGNIHENSELLEI